MKLKTEGIHKKKRKCQGEKEDRRIEKIMNEKTEKLN